MANYRTIRILPIFVPLLISCFLNAETLKIERISITAAEEFRIEVEGETGYYYILEKGNAPVGIMLSVDAQLNNILIDREGPTEPGSDFYEVIRIPINEPLDTDGDGLDDVYELQYPDILSPLTASDPSDDSDGDGITDIEECLLGTHPGVADTGPLPPLDSSRAASPLDPTRIESFAESIAFIYTGANAIQTGVDPATIDPDRAAVIRGKVSNRNGEPLRNVHIQVLNHPEYGETLTQADGEFDMVVNGGTRLTLDYQLEAHCPVQRSREIIQGDYNLFSDVVLIQLDPMVTSNDLESTDAFQVAQSSVNTDADGSRTSTLLFPQGLTAEMIMPDGQTEPITSLSVRSTEFTVGDTGPNAMPGALPPSSGYTYAVELSIDEALASGAVDVRFDKPVFHYVDNFLDFPVGTRVPTGYYDRKYAAWVASNDGLVLGIVEIADGSAVVDTDGDGIGDSGSTLSDLNITGSELGCVRKPPIALMNTDIGPPKKIYPYRGSVHISEISG